MSSGASRCSRRTLSSAIGRYELATTTLAPNFSATSSANPTALLAVSEPSVPTAIVWIIFPPCALSRSRDWLRCLRSRGEEKYLRFPLWMQALLVVMLAVVLGLAVTKVVSDWSDWVVLGGIFLA